MCLILYCFPLLPGIASIKASLGMLVGALGLGDASLSPRAALAGLPNAPSLRILNFALAIRRKDRKRKPQCLQILLCEKRVLEATGKLRASPRHTGFAPAADQ